MFRGSPRFPVTDKGSYHTARSRNGANERSYHTGFDIRSGMSSHAFQGGKFCPQSLYGSRYHLPPFQLNEDLRAGENSKQS